MVEYLLSIGLGFLKLFLKSPFLQIVEKKTRMKREFLKKYCQSVFMDSCGKHLLLMEQLSNIMPNLL